MLIAIDIGNSRIKAGRFEKNNLIDFFSFNKIDEVLNFIKTEAGIDIAVSSVVPEKTKILSEGSKKTKGITPFIISKDLKTNLQINYKTPETLGIDRFCSAEGAFFLLKIQKIIKPITIKFIFFQ